MRNKLAQSALTVIVILLAILYIVDRFVISPTVEQSLNAVQTSAVVLSQRAIELHKTLFIVDLHADSLLWDRDLLARSKRGHADVPRLIQGNVALQAFTIVTMMPRNLDAKKVGFDNDSITLLSFVERWPPATWFSLKQRAIFQADKLAKFAANSVGRLTLIRNVSDLENYVEQRKASPQITAGFLGVEGAHCLEGDLNNINVFYDHGIRMIAPTHFFDNDLGGSSHGFVRGGLTEKGKEMIRRMQQKSMIVDLAHASSATIKDALAVTTRPLIVSHTGVKGTFDSARNLSDEEIKDIAKTGGLVGIGYWPQATGGKDTKAIAHAMRHAVGLAGIDHVALGSDFDGATTVPFDAAGLACLTQTLLDENFSEKEIRAIMGENALRLLRSELPRK